jgi:3D (Asp-Asp-Asp) domain-containing protein
MRVPVLDAAHMPLRLLFLAALGLLLPACTLSLPSYERPIARTQFQRVRTTAYTHTESDHIRHGCQTTLGTTLRCGPVHSAAADWSRWPKGTMFRILDTGEVCEVDDIGWALSGRNTIDLYKPSRAAMNQWGTRTVNIEILRWGSDDESLSLLRKRSKYRHVRRMADDLEKRIASRREEPRLIAVATSAEVPGRGLEPLRISPPDPKSGASANFATPADSQDVPLKRFR